jgi:hypothetical protein
MLRSMFLLGGLVGLMYAGTATSAPPEDAIQERARARLEVARKGLAEAEKVVAGKEYYHDICVWSQLVLESELAVSTTKKERLAALEAHLRRAEKLEKFAQGQFDRGFFSRLALLEAMYRRCDVELQLAQEKAKSESPSR